MAKYRVVFPGYRFGDMAWDFETTVEATCLTAAVEYAISNLGAMIGRKADKDRLWEMAICYEQK